MCWLQILWFFLLFVLFSGLFVLEGFHFGVGMSTKLLACNSDREGQLVATIGPHWDGNEVWLITAGGAMFASYPMWYASLFSGFYIMFFLVLFAACRLNLLHMPRPKEVGISGVGLWLAAV